MFSKNLTLLFTQKATLVASHFGDVFKQQGLENWSRSGRTLHEAEKFKTTNIVFIFVAKWQKNMLQAYNKGANIWLFSHSGN